MHLSSAETKKYQASLYKKPVPSLEKQAQSIERKHSLKKTAIPNESHKHHIDNYLNTYLNTPTCPQNNYIPPQTKIAL